jgi:hypothetical protein
MQLLQSGLNAFGIKHMTRIFKFAKDSVLPCAACATATAFLQLVQPRAVDRRRCGSAAAQDFGSNVGVAGHLRKFSVNSGIGTI